jgi:hypothetical protein
MRPKHVLPVRFGPGAIAALGLLLGISGTLAPRQGAAAGSLAAPLNLQLPDWLVVAAVTALTAASLLFLVLVFARPRTRRKKDDEHIQYIEPRKLNPVVAALLIVLALTPAGILGGAIFWFNRTGVSLGIPGVSSGMHGPALPHTATVPPALPLAGSGRPAPPLTTGLLGSLALLVGFGSLGLVLWLWFGDRLLRRDDIAPEAFRDLVTGAVDDSFEDLRLEPDARTAIIKTYRHFERALAAAELPRRAWQTATEFMCMALRQLPLPDAAVADLTRLFERARFSRHQLGTADREAAWCALNDIRAAVGRGRGSDAAVS